MAIRISIDKRYTAPYEFAHVKDDIKAFSDGVTISDIIAHFLGNIETQIGNFEIINYTVRAFSGGWAHKNRTLREEAYKTPDTTTHPSIRLSVKSCGLVCPGICRNLYIPAPISAIWADLSATFCNVCFLRTLTFCAEKKYFNLLEVKTWELNTIGSAMVPAFSQRTKKSCGSTATT